MSRQVWVFKKLLSRQNLTLCFLGVKAVAVGHGAAPCMQEEGLLCPARSSRSAPLALRQVVRLTSRGGSVSGQKPAEQCLLQQPAQYACRVLGLAAQSKVAGCRRSCLCHFRDDSLPFGGSGVCWWGFRKPPTGVAAQLHVLVATVRYAVVWVWNDRICLVLWLGRCLEGCGSVVVRCCRVELQRCPESELGRRERAGPGSPGLGPRQPHAPLRPCPEARGDSEHCIHTELENAFM